MRRTRWTEEHARLIADAAGPVAPPTPGEVDRVWNRVAASLVDSRPAARTRRSRRRLSLGAGAVAVVLGLSGVAVAQSWDARTGELQTDSEGIRLGGPGELIDPRGADFEEVLREEIADIPFPTVEAQRIAVADQVREARQAASEMERARSRGVKDWRFSYVTGGLRAQAARQAVCAWANTWAAATASGAVAARATAVEMLESAPRWPAVTDIDTRQRFEWKSQRVTTRAGVTRTVRYLDETVFAWIPLVAQAAQGDDPGAVGRPLRESTYCLPELMPDLPEAVRATRRVK